MEHRFLMVYMAVTWITTLYLLWTFLSENRVCHLPPAISLSINCLHSLQLKHVIFYVPKFENETDNGKKLYESLFNIVHPQIHFSYMLILCGGVDSRPEAGKELGRQLFYHMNNTCKVNFTYSFYWQFRVTLSPNMHVWTVRDNPDM